MVSSLLKDKVKNQFRVYSNRAINLATTGSAELLLLEKQFCLKQAFSILLLTLTLNLEINLIKKIELLDMGFSQGHELKSTSGIPKVLHKLLYF